MVKAAQLDPDIVDWVRRAGHCYSCGQPTTYCICTESRPCVCRTLHEIGGGLQPGALAAFMDEPPPGPVSEDQGLLFGGDDE